MRTGVFFLSHHTILGGFFPSIHNPEHACTSLCRTASLWLCSGASPPVFFPPGLFLRDTPLFLQNRQLPLIASTQWPAADGSAALPYAQNFPLVLFIFPAEGSACSPWPLSCRRETSALLCSKSPPKRSRGCTDLME